MEEKLSKVCETYISNRDEMRRILRSHGAPMHLMGAAVLTALGRVPDENKILAAETLLKEREPEDSPIRGPIKSVTTVHMMLADDIESYYKDLKRTHDLIYVNRGGDDERYYMAAMMMSNKISNMQEILMLVDRASVIHDGMGKSFQSLADKSSYVTAAYAATNGVINIRAYLEDVRVCQSLLEGAGIFDTVPEDMCMLLGIASYDSDNKCAVVTDILRAIRAQGMDFDRAEELAMLPFLACIDMDADAIAKAVSDADDFLKLHSGFTEGEGCVLRRVYASMLVTMTYASEKGWEDFGGKSKDKAEAISRMVLMQSQSVMHIQMEYVERSDLNI